MIALLLDCLLSHHAYIHTQLVFKEFKTAQKEFGDLSVLDTRTFVSGMKIGQEISIQIEVGKILFVKLQAVSDADNEGMRQVVFELNGQQRVIKVKDDKIGSKSVQRVKADLSKKGSVGAPMPGVVIGVKVHKGDKVKAGQPLVVLSAMKMETSVGAPHDGIVMSVNVTEGDNVKGGDLIVEIE
eukprot:16583-Heterococcus_DN1.PRE.5